MPNLGNKGQMQAATKQKQTEGLAGGSGLRRARRWRAEGEDEVGV